MDNKVLTGRIGLVLVAIAVVLLVVILVMSIAQNAVATGIPPYVWLIGLVCLLFTYIISRVTVVGAVVVGLFTFSFFLGSVMVHQREDVHRQRQLTKAEVAKIETAKPLLEYWGMKFYNSEHPGHQRKITPERVADLTNYILDFNLAPMQVRITEFSVPDEYALFIKSRIPNGELNIGRHAYQLEPGDNKAFVNGPSQLTFKNVSDQDGSYTIAFFKPGEKTPVVDKSNRRLTTARLSNHSERRLHVTEVQFNRRIHRYNLTPPILR